MIKYSVCQNNQIDEICDHIYRKVDTTIGREAYKQNNTEHCAAIDAALRNKNGVCFVASVDSTIVGYITISPRIRSGQLHAEILQLHVFSEWRHQGVGTKLLALATDWISTMNIPTASVEVSPSNKAALSLYEKGGLVPTTLELEMKL